MSSHNYLTSFISLKL